VASSRLDRRLRNVANRNVPVTGADLITQPIRTGTPTAGREPVVDVPLDVEGLDNAAERTSVVEVVVGD
jgi:hypothetical protein